ncbi:amino acid ABC transporter permease [Labrys monachus]|uniref:His/Glu/Gln/Arg/opine family amino acid ABC transporter permease subunit n=1 Tax=Labrys monachus TaxID=217067 RepID=A0ABU0F783_9HYPH|nr:amino acid ABC transporter permease [Labrys monachus]MDQ0390473.1 His/Glu/Gln/Arg/opine family amino acid ABC transporter permease subunit [Labrys monachus]
MDVLIAQLPRFAAAAWLTLWMFALVTVLSTVIGAGLAVLSEAAGKWVAAPLALFGWIFRGLPELVVLLACYLALPAVGLDLGAVGSAILGFTLIGIAYQVEIFRAGLASIDRRLFEATRALGMGWSLTMRRIVLPQVVRIVLPAWATFAAGNVKAFAVASAIAVTEIMAVTRQTIAISDQPFLVILFAAGIYAAMASVLMIFEAFVSRRFAGRYGSGTRG